MGNRFKCSLAHGGSGGAEGNTLIVTCDPAFAGLTISASKSGTTYTQTCPSTSPYTVTFHGLEAGTWTISAILSGDTYSTSVTITDSTALLSYGFNWAAWVTLGGLDPTDYSDLSDVFADEAAVRRLMLVHASADYLIDAVTGDVDAIDDFCSNDIAMKWIGLCDYVCDGLTAITGVETKFFASTYWERYLKDHVPTMTGNTAPYGKINSSSDLQSGGITYYPWLAFNGTNNDGNDCWHSQTGANSWIEVDFPTPVCVKKVRLQNRNATVPGPRPISTFKIQGSNDGTTWEDIGDTLTNSDTSANAISDYNISNSSYYLKMRLFVVSVVDTYAAIGELQFYGRSLNVSVPIMTSDTLPYGTASSTSSNSDAYKFFNRIDTGAGNFVSLGDTNGRVVFDFGFPIKVAKASALTMYYSHNGTLQYSDDNLTWIDASSTASVSHDNTAYTWLDSTENQPHRYWGIYFESLTSQTIYATEGNFYGVDYSEKEFEAGSTKKWIYDHGVMLEPISAAITTGGSITFNDDYIEINRNNSSANCSVATDSTVDLTGYSYLYAIVGIASGSALWHLIATSNRTAGTSSATAKADVNTASGDTKGGLDISSLNQALYLAVYSGNIAVQDVKELWVA